MAGLRRASLILILLVAGLLVVRSRFGFSGSCPAPVAAPQLECAPLFGEAAPVPRAADATVEESWQPVGWDAPASPQQATGSRSAQQPIIRAAAMPAVEQYARQAGAAQEIAPTDEAATARPRAPTVRVASRRPAFASSTVVPSGPSPERRLVAPVVRMATKAQPVAPAAEPDVAPPANDASEPRLAERVEPSEAPAAIATITIGAPAVRFAPSRTTVAGNAEPSATVEPERLLSEDATTQQASAVELETAPPAHALVEEAGNPLSATADNYAAANQSPAAHDPWTQGPPLPTVDPATANRERRGPAAPARPVMTAQQPVPLGQPPAAANPPPAPVPPYQPRGSQSAPIAPPYMAVISRRAQEHIDYGFDLAERGAVYTAETEFSQALLLIAQALDAQTRSQAHSSAMSAGLRALREADDFVPRGARPDANIARIVAAHQTPVLKEHHDPRLPPLVAMQQYYTYAQMQLSMAGGHEPAASMALYGLGRLQPVLASETDVRKMMGGPKAMALHQAALAVDSQNYMAANELGVLLGRYGQLADAQLAFLHSVQVSPQPENWLNLSLVYDHLGDKRAADHARQQQQIALAERRRHGGPSFNAPPLRYVDPDTFLRESGAGTADAMIAQNNGQPEQPAPQAKPSKLAGRAFSWFSPKPAAPVARAVHQDPTSQPKHR